jgi:Sugar phosphate isomerases/epimerases
MISKYLTRTGICTTDFPLYPAEELFARIADCGYSVVQFGFATVVETEFETDGKIEFPDCAALPSGVLSAIIRAAEKHGIEIAAANGTFNMAHPDAEVRAEGVRRFESFAAASRELGCVILSLCSGTRCREHLWTAHKENASPQAWHDLVDTAKRICEIAERLGLTLAVETEASNVISTPELARRLMDEVGSPSLKMILDPANLFLPGTAKSENVRPILSHAFEWFGHDIVLAHGKDIRASDGIDFCGTGEGIVDFAYLSELLVKYNFAGDMMLHGIYDESKFKSARKYWESKRILNRY